jgi:putative nucleotidyltransferase with HDIG domain
MLGGLFRLFRRGRRVPPPPAPPRPATPAATARPAAPAPARLPDPPRATVDPARPAPEAVHPGTPEAARRPAPVRPLDEQLRRTLEARCRILLDAARPDTLESDAPALVQALLDSNEGLVRQPPMAAQRALSVVRDPLSGIAEVAVLFEQDPALTRALFRAANSALFSRSGEPCVSITHALQRVGQGALEGVILSEMVHGLLCRPGSAYVGLLDQVWTHMTRTGAYARRLAWVFEVDPDAAFTMGLLHDLGKLVVIDQLSEMRARARRDARVPAAFLNDMLNRLHEPIGALAVQHWGLGDEVTIAIAEHHREPPPAVPDRNSELLHVAELVDHAVSRQVGLNLDHVWRQAELTADLTAVRTVLEDEPGLMIYGPRMPGHGDTRGLAA